MKKEKIVNFILSILAIMVIIFVYIGMNKERPNPCKKDKNTEKKGVVIDYGDRDCYYLLSDGNCFKKYYCGNIPIKIGDSIFKPAGTLSYYIYKNSNKDSMFYIECHYNCDTTFQN